MRSRGIPNNQHTSERIFADLRVHKLEGKVDIAGFFILNPAVQIARGEDNIVKQPTALGEICLEPRLVQVLFAGLENELLIILDARDILVMALRDLMQVCRSANTHAQ